MQQINTLCVYCGSSIGRNEAYADAAKTLAKTLVEHNITLVYGGASIGIMGLLADEVLSHNGKVIGVIPEGLAHKEVMHSNLTGLYITQSMHERKMCMADLSDGFIALPGGIGTMEELFEIWTWAQLGIHNKPCGVLNSNGYYDALLQFLQHMLSEQFVKQRQIDMLIVESEAENLLKRLLSYQATPTKKWLDEKEI